MAGDERGLEPRELESLPSHVVVREQLALAVPGVTTPNVSCYASGGTNRRAVASRLGMGQT